MIISCYQEWGMSCTTGIGMEAQPDDNSSMRVQ